MGWDVSDEKKKSRIRSRTHLESIESIGGSRVDGKDHAIFTMAREGNQYLCWRKDRKSVCSLSLLAIEPQRSAGIVDNEAELGDRFRVGVNWLESGIDSRGQHGAWAGEG